MPFDLHPTTERFVELLKDKPPGTQIPREDVIREFNLPWKELEPYFRSAIRILDREHDLLVRLMTPKGTGPILVCDPAQEVAVESRQIRQTKTRTRRTLVLSKRIDVSKLDAPTKIRHEVNAFVLQATHELHRTKVQNDLAVKRGENKDLIPTKELLKFLAS